MSGLPSVRADKRRRLTLVEVMVGRAFKKVRDKPAVMFALGGLGMGWGAIDFRYRDISVRLDAERAHAIAFVSLNDTFSPCWYLHDVLEFVTKVEQGGLSEEELCRRFIQHYDAVRATITSDTGRAALARMQSPYFDKWAAESAAWRDPAEQGRIAAQIEQAQERDRQFWRAKFRDAALILILLTAIVAFLIYSNFIHQQ